MKTKSKVMVLVEIAVVLCSVFLVALPATAIAAEQDDYVLGIYGNANEDDTIDMRDMTYVKLIFFGKKPKTELADAKYDGKLNPLDFIQIKLIIVGKEKELTIEDAAGDAKTISKPIEKIIVLNIDCAEAVKVIRASDRIIGISKYITGKTVFFPQISKLPSVGSFSPDCEKILEIMPDIVISYGRWPSPEKLDDKIEPVVTVVRLDFCVAGTFKEEIIKLGYLLNKKENANKYLEFVDKYENTVEEIVSNIPEKEKPKVFFEWSGKDNGRQTGNKNAAFYPMCKKACGTDIAADLPVLFPVVDLEWILERNPDVIVGNSYGGGYETDDESELKAHYNEIIELPGFDNVTAVKDNRVYILNNRMLCGPSYIVGLSYLAKWFHPHLFEDLNPQEIHQEYINEFCGIVYDVTEHGVFVYPLPAS